MSNIGNIFIRNCESDERLITFRYIAVVIQYLMAAFSYLMTYQLFIPWCQNILGMDIVVIGRITAIGGIAGVVILPFSAPLVDKLNRKRIMVVSTSLLMVSNFGYLVNLGVAWLCLLQVLKAGTWAIISLCGASMVTEIVPNSKRGLGVGIYVTAQAISFAIVPTLAISIVESMGYPPLFIIGGLVSVIAVFIALFFMKGKPVNSTGKALISIFTNFKIKEVFSVEAVPVMLLNTLYTVIQAAFSSYLIAYLMEELPDFNSGLPVSIFGLVMIAARPMSGMLYDKFNARLILILTTVGTVIPCVIFAGFVTPLSVILAAVIYGLLGGGYYSVLKTVAMNIVPKDRATAGQATNNIGINLGGVVAGLLIAGLISCRGYRFMYAVLGGMALAAFVIMLFYVFCYMKRHPDNPARY